MKFYSIDCKNANIDIYIVSHVNVGMRREGCILDRLVLLLTNSVTLVN